MATTVQQQIERAPYGRLSVLRVTVATSLAAIVFVILCWIGARLGFGPVVHYISLFSGTDGTSVTTLLLGICWSFVGGGVIGATYALIYNALAPLEG